MSLQAMTWVFGLEGDAAPTLGTRLVLLALADNAGAKADMADSHVAWPSVALIARKAQISERQVQRNLKWLQTRGFIELVGERPNGVRMWRLNLERGDMGVTPDKLSSPTPTSPGGDMGVARTVSEPPIAAVAAEESPNGLSSSEIGSDSPTASPQSEPAGDAADTAGPPPARYAAPASPGAAAAPWLVLELARLMRANDPKAKVPPMIAGMETLPRPATQDAAREQLKPVLGSPALVKWLDAARLLIDTDGREPREVVKVLRWCQADEFWKTTILSWPKLREKYPQLRGKALQQASPRSSATPGTDSRAQLDALARRREDDEGKASGDAR